MLPDRWRKRYFRLAQMIMMRMKHNAETPRWQSRQTILILEKITTAILQFECYLTAWALFILNIWVLLEINVIVNVEEKFMINTGPLNGIPWISHTFNLKSKPQAVWICGLMVIIFLALVMKDVLERQHWKCSLHTKKVIHQSANKIRVLSACIAYVPSPQDHRCVEMMLT